MSNKRRTVENKRGRTRAPVDPVGSLSADDAPQPRKRSVLGYLLTAGKIAFGAALVVGVAGALAWGAHRYARTTPRFAIDTIEVEGTRRLVREAVVAQAGIEKGDNVFALDVDGAERLLVESPWIRSARITRRLPGAIRIEIDEREPLAVAVIGDTAFLVSQDAEPFKELMAGDPGDLPLVTGLSVDELARDRRAELERLGDALGLLGDYEQLPLARAYPAEEVHLTSSGDAVLTVGSEGVALHLGPSPWKQKLLRAVRVMNKSRAQGGTPGVVFLDNEAHPERVVVRMR